MLGDDYALDDSLAREQVNDIFGKDHVHDEALAKQGIKDWMAKHPKAAAKLKEWVNEHPEAEGVIYLLVKFLSL